jgi:hypothetical protein
VTETKGKSVDPDPAPAARQTHPYRVRLPGFLVEKEVGLGDAINRVTYGMGVRPCGGCEKRAAALNSWVVFTH